MAPNHRSSELRIKNNKEAICKALEAIKTGLSICSVSKKFNVPKTTLLRKLKNGNDSKPIGAPSVLSKEQEEHISAWVMYMSNIGFSVTKEMLLDTVNILVRNLEIPNNFRDNRPGRHWFEGFCKRNPSISQRVLQNLVISRANISADRLKNWFSEVKRYLEQEDYLRVLNAPSRIYNCDETAFFLAPKEKLVLAKKGEKSVHSIISNDEKECITTLVMGNADGLICPPMIMYCYKRIPFSISQNVPSGWGIGRSESGWMTGESFYEYIANIFYPWLLTNVIEFPIILYVDGHVSHLTLTLSEFCKDKGIILIALPPNATHIMQPMDVAVFHPLKSAWRKAVHNWRIQKNGMKIRREDFAPLLEKILFMPNMADNLKSGFKACGLFPFSEDAINYEKLFKKNVNTTSTPVRNEDQSNNQTVIKSVLNYIETEIGEQKSNEFNRNRLCAIWNGSEEDKSLFFLWKSAMEKLTPDKSDAELYISEDEYDFQINNSTLVNNVTSTLDGEMLNNILSDSDPINIEVLDIVFADNNLQETPIKPKNLDVLNLNIPTPFKKNLFWPELKDVSIKPKKEKIPAVASSDQWINYHLKKKKKKESKEHEIAERKRNRLAKKAKSTTATVTYESPAIIEVLGNLHTTDYELQKYIVVEYEGELFPGIIHEKNPTEVFVKVMTMCGGNWRWPEKDDVLWYKLENIVSKIKDPTLINSRGIYAVEEMPQLKQLHCYSA